MKLIFTIIVMTFFTSLTFAKDGLIAKACYKEHDKKYGTLIVEVSIYKDSVILNYSSLKHGTLGRYYGRIIDKSFIKQTETSVSVENITLNDGGDGFIDNAKIEIKKESVTFDSKYNIVGAHARVQCLK